MTSNDNSVQLFNSAKILSSILLKILALLCFATIQFYKYSNIMLADTRLQKL